MFPEVAQQRLKAQSNGTHFSTEHLLELCTSVLPPDSGGEVVLVVGYHSPAPGRRRGSRRSHPPLCHRCLLCMPRSRRLLWLFPEPLLAWRVGDRAVLCMSPMPWCRSSCHLPRLRGRLPRWRCTTTRIAASCAAGRASSGRWSTSVSKAPIVSTKVVPRAPCLACHSLHEVRVMSPVL